MKHNPLAVVCIFFCLGIWAATPVHIPLVFVYISCILFLLTALVSLKRQFLFFISLSAAIFLAGFLHLQNAQTYPANHISNFVSDNPQIVYLMGKVVSGPEISQTFYHSKKTTFTLRVRDLKTEESWQDVKGLIKVALYGERQVHYGDELLLQGALSCPPGLRNPGGFDYRAYLANHNIFATLSVKEKDTFKLTKKGSGAFLISEMFKFKQRLRRIIVNNLAPPQAALLSAILLGERATLSQDTKDIFINTGTIHILAISGLHVGLIAFILIAIFRLLRMRRSITFILTIFLLICYALLSGGRPSVIRATIMAVIVLLGFLINREIEIYNSLGLAALIILIVHPQYLFEAGFQLSFLSVISIVYFAPKIEKSFSAAHRGFSLYLTRAFSVSLAAWIGIVPLLAYHFNIVTPVAVLANLLVIPCLFLVVSVGICFLAFAYVWAPLGAIFAQTCWFSLFGLTKLALLISKTPLGSYHCPKPSIILFCSYYLLLLFVFNYRRLKVSSGKMGITLVLAASVLVWRPLLNAPSDKLTVSFLDVGHGDSIFIEFPYQGTMLIDGGSGGENDAGRWVILPFLRNKGIREIDAVVLTHPDDDHVGGLDSVLKNVKVNYVFDNGMPKRSIGYSNYKATLAKNVPDYRVIGREEKILGFPQVELLVLHPPQPFLAGSGTDINNNSLVLRLAYKDVSFLFCGDIEKEAIERILPYSPMLKSTIIKVPHHGSDLGEIENQLFQAVSPQLAVINGDRDSRFKFSAPRVLQRLEALGAKVYTTGDTGAVIISTDGQNIWVETMVGLLH